MSDNTSNQPNLDLINMVQQARLQHDATARPSDYAAVYWIEAKRDTGDYPALTAQAGEWRIKLTIENVDAIWEQVKTATRAGKLGYKSKVSTRPAVGQSHPDERLLCVRTYNADDKADLARVEQSIRDLGIHAEITYIRDKD